MRLYKRREPILYLHGIKIKYLITVLEEQSRNIALVCSIILCPPLLLEHKNINVCAAFYVVKFNEFHYRHVLDSERNKDALGLIMYALFFS